MLGLHCCASFSLVAASQGYSLVAVHSLFISVASLAVDHRLQALWLQWLWTPGSRARRFTCFMACGVSGAGIKPVSPELAGGVFTSEPPGQPQLPHFTNEDCASREVTSLTQGHIITKPKIPNFPTIVIQSTPPPQYLLVLFCMQKRYHLWPQLPLDPRNTFIKNVF